jgi:hypothetical protein
MATRLRSRVLIIGFTVMAALALPPAARADSINVGILSLVSFIPGSPPSPGVSTFDIDNLTAGFALSSDFPVEQRLTFLAPTLELYSNKRTTIIPLGDIVPGSVSIQALLFSADEVFYSAVFHGTLDVVDLGTLGIVSPAVVGILVPGEGTSLSVDSFTLLTVEPVPEPATLLLLGSGIAALGWKRRRRQSASLVRAD